MDVGIGLPNAVPGTSGAQLIEWARRADGRGFSSLGTIDRIVYDNYEPLTALAAAAAVTERIGLCTSVLLGPLRENPVELAKQALSVHALSGGRLTLGIGLGGRDDDYAISGLETKGGGKRLDEMLERMREIWDGDEVGPSSEGSPRVVIGGAADASFARTARFGEGWIAGGSSPDEYAEMAGKGKAAWPEAGPRGARRGIRPRPMRRDGREGEGRLVGSGPRGRAAADEPGVLRPRRQRGGGRRCLPDRLLRLAGRGDRRLHRRQRRQGRGDGAAVRGRLHRGRLRRADLLPLLQRPRPGRPAGGRAGQLRDGALRRG